MDSGEWIAQLIFGLIICALVALIGKNRKIGYGMSLVACMFLTPVIGLIIILCSKKKDEANYIDAKK